MKNPPKPKVEVIGTCVIERDGDGFLVMFCDGSVRPFTDYVRAVKSISKYFAKHTPKDAIGVGQIVYYDGSTATKVSRNGFVVEI